MPRGQASKRGRGDSPVENVRNRFVDRRVATWHPWLDDCGSRRMLGRHRQSSRRRVRPVLGGLMLVAAALLLAGCVAETPNGEKSSSAEPGVAASPRVVAYGEPVPKGGGRYLVGDPYRIAGHTYVPHDYSSYSAIGLASW